MQDVITLAESKRAIALEKIIATGKQTFVEVGLALAEMRDSRLYRADYDTFEEYCRGKWGWSRPYCIQLIEAAGVVKSLPEGVAIATESQARELAKVPQGQRARVIKAALEAGPVTAKAIREAAEELSPKAEVMAHTVAMPQTLDDRWKDALGGKMPESDPMRLSQHCYNCCVAELLGVVTVAQLESLKASWHSDMHTSCLGLVNERLAELKAEAKRAAKAQRKSNHRK